MVIKVQKNLRAKGQGHIGSYLLFIFKTGKDREMWQMWNENAWKRSKFYAQNKYLRK